MHGSRGAALDRPMLRERQEDFRADGIAAMVLMGSNHAEGASRPTAGSDSAGARLLKDVIRRIAPCYWWYNQSLTRILNPMSQDPTRLFCEPSGKGFG